MRALAGGEDVELRALLQRQVVDGQAAEDVVEDGAGDPQIRIVGHAGGLEASVGEGLDVDPQRHAVLEAVAHRHGEGVHDAGQGGALLGDAQEDLTGAAVLVLADGDEALAVGDAELEGVRAAVARQLLPRGHLDDALHDPFHDPLHDLRLGPRGDESVREGIDGALLLGRGEGLTHLAVVAVDGDGLDAQLPGVDVELLHLFDGGLFRQVDRLGDGA